ncbi:MAG: helix-turn-helix domain-containing protein [Chloroflexota bacterium]
MTWNCTRRPRSRRPAPEAVRQREPPRVAPLLLKPEEAADALGIGRTRVYQLMREGELRSLKIGKSRRIPVAALEAFVGQLEAELE